MTSPSGVRLSLRAFVVSRGVGCSVAVETLEIGAGELAVCLGARGSGKTMLALALAGTLPVRGQVVVDGREVGGTASRRRRAGLVVLADEPWRLEGCSVGQALAVAATAGRRPEQALERFPELGDRTRVSCGHLSAIGQRWLRLACAWLAEPAVLVLDVPASGLGRTVAGRILDLVAAEVNRGVAVLWLDRPAAALPGPLTHHLEDGRVTAIESYE